MPRIRDILREVYHRTTSLLVPQSLAIPWLITDIFNIDSDSATNPPKSATSIPRPSPNPLAPQRLPHSSSRPQGAWHSAYSGIEDALWYPMVAQDATNRSVLKITGTVGTAAMGSSDWTNSGLTALFGNWDAAKKDVDSKLRGVTNTKIAVVAFFVGDDLQIITIGDKNVEYAKAHTNGLITVRYPNFPDADVITLDVNSVTFWFLKWLLEDVLTDKKDRR